MAYWRRNSRQMQAATNQVAARSGVAVARRGVDVEIGLAQVARFARRQVAAAGDAMEDP